MTLSKLPKEIIAIFAIIILACTVASSQTRRAQSKRPHTNPNRSSNCTLKLMQAPEIRGIRLGMSLEEIVSDFPSVQTDYDRSINEYGEAFLIDLPIENRYRFEGIFTFRLSFIDKRVSFFSVTYSDYSPRNLDEFAQQVSEKLGLQMSWKTPAKGIREIKCDGFTVLVVTHPVLGPALIMYDLVANETVRKRKAEKEAERKREEQQRLREEEERRRVFKP